ncbi:GNAT family N-acetyltransferase [Rubrivirga sp.]|uniref:GNAT family N-acetyltransferase n=1 Tax=Rubrivirga sp. TaxID=1885344 RepID=UPI003C76A63E
MTWARDDYTVTDDRDRLDLEAVHAYLTRSYWSTGVPLEVVRRAAAESVTFGLYLEGEQVGYARVVTDRATFAYLCDVYVLEEHRGRGLGRWLVECVMDHPGLQGLRRWLLTTQDAHRFYERLGFDRTTFPERFMTIDRPGLYLDEPSARASNRLAVTGATSRSTQTHTSR